MDFLADIAAFLSDYILVAVLMAAAVWYTISTRAVQIRMAGQMLRLLFQSGRREPDSGGRHISSFEAFMVSIASRVGTGNLAGVATAIAVGGPGAVFWMWVIALLGAATAFIESTLAQLFKVRGKDSFIGGPAYYIFKGTGKRWWAATFAVLITITFGLAFNSVQANTIAAASASAFGFEPVWVAAVLAAVTLVIISGGITRIARFSAWVVPFMAIAYIILTLYIIVLHFSELPAVFALIFRSAFGLEQAAGGGLGMALIMGVKRGLFSNEAGEGSTPNAAATATVSHPVKQGLIQALGVFTDTLLICTCTALIVLFSGLYTSGDNGITLTQNALDSLIGAPGFGSTFVAIAIFFFAFTSIIANYYYGEANLMFISRSRPMLICYRLMVAALVAAGSVASLDLAWTFADVTMALMTLCNLAALAVLGKYAIRCMHDYSSQLRLGHDPVYHRSTIPAIAEQTECWPE